MSEDPISQETSHPVTTPLDNSDNPASLTIRHFVQVPISCANNSSALFSSSRISSSLPQSNPNLNRPHTDTSTNTPFRAEIPATHFASTMNFFAQAAHSPTPPPGAHTQYFDEYSASSSPPESPQSHTPSPHSRPHSLSPSSAIHQSPLRHDPPSPSRSIRSSSLEQPTLNQPSPQEQLPQLPFLQQSFSEGPPQQQLFQQPQFPQSQFQQPQQQQYPQQPPPQQSFVTQQTTQQLFQQDYLQQPPLQQSFVTQQTTQQLFQPQCPQQPPVQPSFPTQQQLFPQPQVQAPQFPQQPYSSLPLSDQQQFIQQSIPPPSLSSVSSMTIQPSAMTRSSPPPHSTAQPLPRNSTEAARHSLSPPSPQPPSSSQASAVLSSPQPCPVLRGSPPPSVPPVNPTGVPSAQAHSSSRSPPQTSPHPPRMFALFSHRRPTLPPSSSSSSSTTTTTTLSSVASARRSPPPSFASSSATRNSPPPRSTAQALPSSHLSTKLSVTVSSLPRMVPSVTSIEVESTTASQAPARPTHRFGRFQHRPQSNPFDLSASRRTRTASLLTQPLNATFSFATPNRASASSSSSSSSAMNASMLSSRPPHALSLFSNQPQPPAVRHPPSTSLPLSQSFLDTLSRTSASPRPAFVDDRSRVLPPRPLPRLPPLPRARRTDGAPRSAEGEGNEEEEEEEHSKSGPYPAYFIKRFPPHHRLFALPPPLDFTPFGPRCSFAERTALLHNYLRSYTQPYRHPRVLKVQRERLLETSIDELKELTSEEWINPFVVSFHNERGIDQGGLRREWFTLLILELTNPDFGLFVIENNNNNRISISRSASAHRPDARELFYFIGCLLRKALLEQITVPAYFTLFLFKCLLNEPIHHSDLASVDPDFARSLAEMENDDVEPLDLPFAYDTSVNGTILPIELVNHGSDIVVTNSNKLDYIFLASFDRLFGGITDYIQSLKEGFTSFLPSDLLSQRFTAEELQQLICGQATIDLNDWKQNTRYVGYSYASPTIRYFWEILQEMSQNERQSVLEFVTGCRSPPALGFKALQSSEHKVEPFTITRLPTPNKNFLPVAHSCFNRLDLPDYGNKAVLMEKLTLAIHSLGDGFQIS